MVAKNQFVGQGAAQGKTDTFGFSVNKFKSDKISNQVLSGFTMPKDMRLNGTREGGVGTVVCIFIYLSTYLPIYLSLIHI